jgi:DNA mismatch repair protein PMS2
MLIVAQRGTTVTVTGLFVPLPVRRKELERHAKREFTKALNLLTAYALVPCTRENNGVVLTISNTPDGGYVSRVAVGASCCQGS